MLLIFSALLFGAQASVVLKSGDNLYRTCAEVSKTGHGLIYLAVSYRAGETPRGCETEPKVILKCATAGHGTMIANEFTMLNRLSSASWSPSVYGFIEKGDVLVPCVAMESLGWSLEKIRNGYAVGTKWSWGTLGTIGARTIEIMKALHLERRIIHTDSHPGNWLLERTLDGSLSRKLKLIDFGDAHDISDPSKRLEDVQQQIAALRYYFDGDYKFFVYKRMPSIEVTLAGMPETFAEAFRYVKNLRNAGEIDYDKIHGLMVRLAAEHGVTYKGEIDWHPVQSTVGLPRASIMQKKGPKPLGGQPINGFGQGITQQSSAATSEQSAAENAPAGKSNGAVLTSSIGLAVLFALFMSLV